ncbi:MAG: DNA polymerase III subunit epsilon [Candidatus Accumulibacter sp.]|nr:DNA polymerase III subunit epsilon [Accumulibacter sp.]
MRQLILDTETTGLEYRQGHRIIEIGGVEMLNRRPTRRQFHYYLNPERDIEDGALALHGISLEFLQDKPRFADIVEEFLEFARGAELIIHNAPFDVGFLNAELALLGRPPIETVCHSVTDSLKLAKELHPGKRNSLDMLCERYGIDNSKRTLHGALLDAELLSEVYLAMTRGQESLIMEIERDEARFRETIPTSFVQDATPARQPRVVLRAGERELTEHDRLLASIDRESKGKCLWLAGTASA